MNSEKTVPDEYRINLGEIVLILDELKGIAKPEITGKASILKEYGVRLLNKIREVNPVEPFVTIRIRTIHRLEKLLDVPNHVLNAAFKSNRNKLVGILDSYANHLQKEFLKIE
jgi:peptidyl-tRNA hydrolase